MAWMKISEYQKTFVAGSRPTRATIVGRIKSNLLVGKFEGMWYVDPDQEPAQPTIQDTADEIFKRMSAARA